MTSKMPTRPTPGSKGALRPTPLKDSVAYRYLAEKLILLCRFLVQVHELSISSSFRFKHVLIVADDALRCAADSEASRRTSEVDDKFGKAFDLLSDFAKDFPFKDPTSDANTGGTVTGEGKTNDKYFKSILHGLKKYLHSNPMGYEMPYLGSRRIVEFHLLRFLHDTRPIIVRQAVGDSPSLQGILWNFCCFKDKMNCLTLKGNPHFYRAGLFKLLKAYRGNVQIQPTEDFRNGDKFYVLTDKKELVHIITGNQILQSFSNLWRSRNAIIFKDICGRLRGEGIVKASLGGECSGFYVKRLPVSSVIPRAFRTPSRNRGLQPIGTELYPTGWELFIDRPSDSSADPCAALCLYFFTEREAPDSPLLTPLPPTCEEPGYRVAYRTHIHDLDNDSLFQIFRHYRLKHEENWNLRLTWRNLAQVCRRWRYFVFDLWSHLDVCLLLTNNSPSMVNLSHLPPIPLVINYSDRTRTMTLRDVINIRLGLQRHDRVRRVDLQAPSSSIHGWLLQMNQLFPRLTDLSLLSTTTETDEASLVLPETLQAPNLRRLSLHGIGLPTGLLLLSSSIALSTLSLTHIRASCYVPPSHLATQLKGLPHVEELSIGFAIPIPLPGSEGELFPAPILPVTLPALRRLTFRGVDTYLDNLVAQINAPLLERLTLTLHFDLTFTLANLAEFIRRTEGSRWLVAQVIFNKDGVSIDAGYNEQQGVGKSSLHVNINCEPLDWQIDSATQVCSALGKVLLSVEELTLDLRVSGMPSNWESTLEDVPWHELLLPFIGVKKLHIGSSLTFELSQALKSDVGGFVLPELQVLEVSLKIKDVINALTAFIENRELMGRRIHLMVPPEDEEGHIHLQNTLATWRSRRQVREYHWQRKLDEALAAVDAERKEKEKWKTRALALEELLKELDVSLSGPFSGGF